MIVNSKPSEKRKFIWQSLINVDKLKGALRTLKNINWLYADLDENSLDDALRRVIESVSDATSTMLEKVSVEDISLYCAHCSMGNEPWRDTHTPIDEWTSVSLVSLTLS